MTMPAIAPITWLTLTVEELGRWCWQQQRFLPEPLTSSSVGQWQPSVEELLGLEPAPQTHRSRGEERLLDSLADVLQAPGYCAYVIRGEGTIEWHYAAVVRGDDALALVIGPETVRVGRVQSTLIAAVLANEVPKVLSAPTLRIELPPQTAELLAAGVARKAPPATLRSALVSAGIPESMADRVLADERSVRAMGTVGAMRYSPAGAIIGSRCASWTEMTDGGMMSSTNRAGDVVWEPLTAPVLARAVADALTSLGS